MLRTLKKFFAFCGEDNRKMFIISIWLGVVSAVCSAMRIPAAAIVIQALLQKNVTVATLWTSLGIIMISLIITIAINMKATMLQTRAGCRACANKRIEICLLYTSRCVSETGFRIFLRRCRFSLLPSWKNTKKQSAARSRMISSAP